MQWEQPVQHLGRQGQLGELREEEELYAVSMKGNGRGGLVGPRGDHQGGGALAFKGQQ